MCGFTGYINKKEKEKSTIEKMSERIIHRGPDSNGFYRDEYIELAFRRLAIIDLDGGSQPIYNEDGTKVIIFNGEIYNYKELRRDLEEKGHVMSSNADTEVILHGYEEYGVDILNKLRGMFAFAIWDNVKNELFLARDIFGIKPLYYAEMNGTFMFASEIKALLEHPDFIKEVNKEALKPYLEFQYNPLVETFFKGVYKLEPRHYILYDVDNPVIKPQEYMSIDFSKQTGVQGDEITEVMKESVAYHKISDVKVGAFLSSGIDSSYIVSLLHPDDTFTVGFADKGFDEGDRAQVLSENLGVANHRKTITPDDFFASLPKVQYYSDEPHANLSSVPLYFLSEFARKNVTVVLSGEGADELFAGYDSYRSNALLSTYRRIPKFLRRFAAKIAAKLPDFRGKHFIMRGSYNLDEEYIGQARIFDACDLPSFVQDDYLCGPDAHDITAPYFAKVQKLDDVSKMQYLDMFLWLPNDILLKADKMTMAHSLELRVPYLDKEVLSLASRLQKKDKINARLGKYALRKAAEESIPKEWFERPKLGFMVPFKNYLRMDKYYETVKKEFSQDYVEEFFDREAILALLDKHHDGICETHRKVYTIYSFLLWYKEYFLKN